MTSDVIASVLAALRADAGVQAFFGAPPRIFDDETAQPIYPYAQLVSAETSDIASALTPGGEHRLTFAVHARHGGRAEAATGLRVLAEAVRAANFSLPGASVVLAHPVYLDVVRGRNARAFRGLMRLRIVTDEGVNS